MRLECLKPYLSFKSITCPELPDFAILTGPNGSGKSHLLRAMSEGAVKVDDIANPGADIRYFDYTTLLPNNNNGTEPRDLRNRRENAWAVLANRLPAYRTHFVNLATQYKIPNYLQGESELPGVLTKVTEDELTTWGNEESAAAQASAEIQRQITAWTDEIKHQIAQSNPNDKFLFDAVELNAGIPLVCLDKNSFLDNFPAAWGQSEMFHQDFATLFLAYQIAQTENILRKHHYEEGDRSLNFLTPEQFVEVHNIPLWDFVNNILLEANLDFTITAPDKTKADQQFKPVLIKKSTKAEVEFSQLSSGEKILVSFGLCLYYARDTRTLVRYPKVLLLDEIDAPLNPPMVKMILRTIRNVLVAQNGIKVIMTTHSPTTVAIAPDDAIYAVTAPSADDDMRRLKVEQTTKDKALAILTEGVPTLSISHTGRRAVVVEGELDAKIYDRLFQVLKSRLNSERSLQFSPVGFTDPSTGTTNGAGCAAVKARVKDLRQAGQRDLFGLIDWDTVNEPDDDTAVLAKDLRYSLENLILDPLVLATVICQSKGHPKKLVGVQDNETIPSLARDPLANVKRLQEIADHVQNTLIEPFLEGVPPQSVANYVGGVKVALRNGYLQKNGHDLELLAYEKYQCLKQYQSQKGGIFEEASLVLQDYPELIPSEIVAAFSCLLNM